MSSTGSEFPVIQAYGPDAYRVQFASRPDAEAFQRGLQLSELWPARLGPVLQELVPAFTTLLLVFHPGHRPPVEFLGNLPFPVAGGGGETGHAAGRVVELPVCYQGPDLPRVADHAGLSPAEVVERHQAPLYHVHCLGFAPGFPYLGGLDERLATPRRSSPRPRVPAGSVAIGGRHTGIYSISSPGGWNLVGETRETLFQPWAQDTETMFRIRAGDRVRFIPVEAQAAAMSEPAGVPAWAVDGAPLLRVINPGTGLGIQDQGRPGYARFGVPAGGAMDPISAGWANRLLDNPPEAPVLELCFQGQKLEVLRDGWIALAGAARERSGRLQAWTATRVQSGEVLEFGADGNGIWSYLAVPGGFEGPRCLGSASENPRAGIGRVRMPGETLSASREAAPPPSFTAGRRILWNEVPRLGAPEPIRVWPGPQACQFTEEQRARFFASAWRISSQSDRVGYRLEGPVLVPPTGDMESEPVLPGSIQVPPGGQPIVTQRDGPTLGGYPKLGIVEPADLARVAQTRPGREIRFVPAG